MRKQLNVFKNKRSCEIPSKLNAYFVNNSDNDNEEIQNKMYETLDFGPVSNGIQQNIRLLLRNKNKHLENYTMDNSGYISKLGERNIGVKWTHFGMVDKPHKLYVAYNNGYDLNLYAI